MAPSIDFGHTHSSVMPNGKPDDDELWLVWEAKHKPIRSEIERFAYNNNVSYERGERILFNRFRTGKLMSGFYNVSP